MSFQLVELRFRRSGLRTLAGTSVAGLLCFLGACSPGSAGVDQGPPSSSSLLTLSPAGDWHIGPDDEFVPGALHGVYTLANQDTKSVHWQMKISEPWIALTGPSSGELLPGQSVELPVDVDSAAASLKGAASAVAHVVVVDPTCAANLAEGSVTVDSSFLVNDNGGWTSFTPSADTRTVYVSSASGSDQFDGLSESTPKRTLAAAVPLLRHGFPDWLLLKRGDVWQESLGQWKKSGRSASEPLLVSSYGTAPARPLLRTGTQSGLWTSGGGGSPATIDNLALVGVHFHADAYSGGGECFGAQFLQPGSHVLIEDCEFEGYGVNLVFQGYGGRHTDFRLRRSVVVDAYCVHAIGGHSQGLYAFAVDGLLIEENVFDHNGWNESVPGAGADIFSHNVYIDNDNTGVVVRGNILSNASSHGMQLRPGGTVVNNLFVRNSIALSVGGGNSPEPDGVTANVRGNVIVDGKNIDAANPRGWGMWFANIASGHVVSNVIANNTLGAQPNVMTLDGQHTGDTHPSIGVHELVIERNILFNWGGSLLVKGNSSQITDVELVENDVQNTSWPASLIEHPVASSIADFHSGGNHFFCQLMPVPAWTEIGFVPHTLAYWLSQVGDSTSTAQQMAYVDPLRSPASYNALIGGGASLGEFLDAIRQQSATHWRPELLAVCVNRYIRGGF